MPSPHDHVRVALESKSLDALLALEGDPSVAAWRGAGSDSTALHLAITQGIEAAPALAFLLAHGLDPLARNNRGRTALAFVFESPQAGRLGWLEALWAAGVPVDYPNEDGQTALSLAVCRGPLPLLEWFLARGVTPTARDRVAVLERGSDRECVALFWDTFGEDMTPEQKDAAFVGACGSSRWSMAELLLDRGASPHATDAAGRTGLLLACERGKGSVALVERLVVAGVDPRQPVLGVPGEPVTARSVLAQRTAATSKMKKRKAALEEAMARGTATRLAAVLSDDTPAPARRARL